MTREEIDKIPFKFISHTSFDAEYACTYYAEYKSHVFLLCDHVPIKEINPRGRGYRHYAVDGKVFKTKKKFYQFCETI